MKINHVSSSLQKAEVHVGLGMHSLAMYQLESLYDRHVKQCNRLFDTISSPGHTDLVRFFHLNTLPSIILGRSMSITFIECAQTISGAPLYPPCASAPMLKFLRDVIVAGTRSILKLQPSI